jgi:nucleoside-diphosphate kinase
MGIDARGLETTLVLLKPDAVQRRLVGPILQRFEQKGLQFVGMKMVRIPRAQCEEQYAAHKGKDFYDPLVNYMSSSPVIALAIRGKDAVRIVRAMVGATFGSQAAPGTVRGDFAISNRFNLVHASDSPASAGREIAIYFRPDEVSDDLPSDMAWVYDVSTGTIV